MAQQVITFHYDLRDEKKEMMESSKSGEPLSFLEGSGQIIPGLEKELIKLTVGKKQEVFVSYQEGYGPYDQSLVVEVPRKEFPVKEVKEGDLFQVEKEGEMNVVRVIEIADDKITIDANHPMAGKNLIFVVEVTNRRDATPEEIAHGHVHDGHAHH
ncbi:MAG: hypothetical protein A2Z88_03110 [Omnitrophica WOR_2 bacterium GWA2_47_8]|nr:MAG: hypothetical protein A2Z88_03110 [Omnitrophica WOR_2 bacterium GWA2_47_8]